MWETLFHQAKALTNIFIDPNDSAFTHIARSISQKEVLKLKKAWSNDNKTLKIKDLETMFFPKVSTKLQLKQHKYKTSSRVTGQEYSHGRTMFKEASDEEYLKIFDRLAGYAKSGTSEPSSLDWISLAALTLKTEKLTNDFLHHVMSWFDSEDHSKGAAKNAPRQWIDLLEAGPLANRGGLSEGVLVHRDKSSKEAARCLVQALFEKIREFDGLGDDWTKSVSLLLFHGIQILISQGPSNSDRFLSDRELSLNVLSRSMLSTTLSRSRMVSDPENCQKPYRLAI